jgi:hypothetical protein
MKTPVLPVPTDSMQNLLKPVPRYYFTGGYAFLAGANFKVSKSKSKGFVHFIMYGEENKIKKYDYIVYRGISQRLKILTKEQVRFGNYNFMHYK